MEINYEQSKMIDPYGNILNLESQVQSKVENNIRMNNQKNPGGQKYNISEIIELLKSLNGKEIVHEVSKLLKEKKVFLFFVKIRKTSSKIFIEKQKKTNSSL